MTKQHFQWFRWAKQSPQMDRKLGCILGQILGDAFGLSTEFMTRQDGLKLYGNHPIPFPNFCRNEHNKRWIPGDWTDDTDQMLLIMDTLTEKLGFDPWYFAKRLVGWLNRGFPECGDSAGMGQGAMTQTVCSHPYFTTVPFLSSADYYWKHPTKAAANGALMRTSIVGCFHPNDAAATSSLAQQFCRVTHWDPRCVASCVLVSLLINDLIFQSPVKIGPSTVPMATPSSAKATPFVVAATATPTSPVSIATPQVPEMIMPTATVVPIPHATTSIPVAKSSQEKTNPIEAMISRRIPDALSQAFADPPTKIASPTPTNQMSNDIHLYRCKRQGVRLKNWKHCIYSERRGGGGIRLACKERANPLLAAYS